MSEKPKSSRVRCSYCGLYYAEFSINRHIRRHQEVLGASDIPVAGWIRVDRDFWVHPEVIRRKEREYLDRGIIT